MSATTKIEWCDATWNPITGCTPCSPGCERCYAANMVRRFQHLHDNGTDPLDTGPFPLPFSRVQFHPERLDVPLHWRKPRKVFVCSMGDLFHKDVPNDWIDRVFETFDAAPQHTYLILTKRPQSMADYIERTFCTGAMETVYQRVWLGVTVCNQAEANAKIPALLRTPAALRFVSIEPMLGPVDLARYLHIRRANLRPASGPLTPTDSTPLQDGDVPALHWVICGGETGPGARQMWHNWATDLRDQCLAAGVPFFYKGMGTARLPKSHTFYHLLDGREWHQFPEVHP